MIISKKDYESDYSVEFLLERPVGWSSACLDFAMDYYLSCSSVDLETQESSMNTDFKKEKL